MLPPGCIYDLLESYSNQSPVTPLPSSIVYNCFFLHNLGWWFKITVSTIQDRTIQDSCFLLVFASIIRNLSKMITIWQVGPGQGKWPQWYNTCPTRQVMWNHRDLRCPSTRHRHCGILWDITHDINIPNMEGKKKNTWSRQLVTTSSTLQKLLTPKFLSSAKNIE